MGFDELRGLVELLEEWSELPGTTRIELRPYDKHTGKLLVQEDECPRLAPELLMWELREAYETAVAVSFLKRLVRELAE